MGRATEFSDISLGDGATVVRGDDASDGEFEREVRGRAGRLEYGIQMHSQEWPLNRHQEAL